MYKITMILAVLCLAAPLAASEWHVEAIDDYGGNDTALTLDDLNRPRVAYVSDYTLTYARWDGSDWLYDSIYENYDLDGLIDLALDDEEYPHFVYCLHELSEYVRFLYTYIDGSGQHDIQVEYDIFLRIPLISLDLDSSQHTHISFVSSYFTYAYWDGVDMHRESVASQGDIAVDGDDRPCIAAGWVGDELKLMIKDGGEWSEEVVDSGLALARSCSIAFDSLDRPHIAYYDGDEDDLRYAYRDGSWRVEVVDSDGDVGRYCSLALDSNNEPHVAYYDNTNNDLIYAYRDGGEWHREAVDAVGDVALGASLALDSYDRPHISYNNEIVGAVMYATLVEDLFHLVWPEKGEEIDTLTPTLDWEDHEISDLESYTLWWGEDPDFAEYEEVTGLTESEYRITGGIQEGDRIWWRVKSVDESGGEHWAEERDWYFDVDTGGGVEVVDFGAEATDEGVLVSWRLEGEMPVGIRVLRDEDYTGREAPHGDGLPGNALLYLDRDVEPGVEYRYWLEVTGADGSVMRFGPTDAVTMPEVGSELLLYAAYPNPARDAIYFVYSLPAEGSVELCVYDLSGRRVAALVDAEQAAGRHEVAWDCAEIPSGVYLYSLETDSGTLTQRLVVSR
jgi:hypothetical protein